MKTQRFQIRKKSNNRVYAPYYWSFVFSLVKSDRSKIPEKYKQKYHFDKASEIDFQIPQLKSKIMVYNLYSEKLDTAPIGDHNGINFYGARLDLIWYLVFLENCLKY